MGLNKIIKLINSEYYYKYNKSKHPIDVVSRLFEKLKEPKDHINDCWEWLAYKNEDGYGMFMPYPKTKTSAHRFAYEFFYGPIPKGLYVLHKCDNPCCCNPNHFFLGDQTANMKDMINKDRPRGQYRTTNETKFIPKQISDKITNLLTKKMLETILA
jgi:hypothetical protein